jgi:polyhydroxybutyrate depolymerase
MKMVPLIVFGLFLISCESSGSIIDSAENITEPTVDYSFYIEQTIEGVAVQREVLVHTPADLNPNEKQSIVIAFHGNGGQNDMWMNKFSSFVNSSEFIGVYPQGHLKSWNLGTEASTADEVYFLNQIMTKLETYSFFETSKVYGIGYSNGSGLLNKLAIETSYFTAIAPLASQLIAGTVPSVSTVPVSVYQMCGTADPIIPYDGGMSVVGHTFLSGADSALSWALAFGCETTPEIEMLGSDQIYTYQDCFSGKEILFHSVHQGNHSLNQSNDPDFYNRIWRFLKQF